MSFIPLINNSKNIISTEASIKYFITQALASTILLLSLLLLSSNLPYNIVEYSATIIFNSALLTKMGAAPFHFWFPEVIVGLDWNNALILLTLQKIAPITLIMYNIDINFFSIIIIFCIIIRGIIGINQISLRKILAYSSINHIGWILRSIIFTETIWIWYFIVYALTTIIIIYILKINNISYLKQLFITLKNQPITKFLLILNFISLGGLPPFIGFFPKWITIQAIIINNYIIVSVIIIVITLITLFFYIRITFSTIVLSANEINFFNSIKKNSFVFLLLNFITLSGLIYCTLIFNYI